MADVAFPSDTLKVVRAAFIQATKRYSLITNGDLSTNADNGANVFINMGQRYLDLTVDHPRLRKRRYKKKMAIGDISVEVRGLISIDTLALVSVGESRYDITENVLDAQELKRKVGKPLAMWESGRPYNWAINDIGLVAEHYTVAQFVNASASTETTGTATDTFAKTTAQDGAVHQIAHDSGALEMFYEFNVSAIGNPDDVQILMVGRLDGGNDTLTVSAYDWGAAAWVEIDTLTGTDEINLRTTIYTLPVSYVGTGSDASKVRLQFKKASGLTIAKLIVDYLICGPSLVDYEDVHFSPGEEFDGILFDTKVDKAYSVEVVGKFYSKILDTDTDKSFWTIRHPDLLVLAAAYCYERLQRNTSGMRDWLEAMAPLLEQIDNSAVEMDMSGLIMRLEA